MDGETTSTERRFRRIANWVTRHKAGLLQFGWPFLLYEGFNWVFDKGFFPVALWLWGPTWGAIIASATALFINACVFWVYDYMKVDWLKAYALRELADKENKSHLETILTWHRIPRTTLRERIFGEIRFALLLIPVDPVIIAIYYRQNYFEGVSLRDWLVLVKATVVACVVWLLILEPVVWALRYVYDHGLEILGHLTYLFT